MQGVSLIAGRPPIDPGGELTVLMVIMAVRWWLLEGGSAPLELPAEPRFCWACSKTAVSHVRAGGVVNSRGNQSSAACPGAEIPGNRLQSAGARA